MPRCTVRDAVQAASFGLALAAGTPAAGAAQRAPEASPSSLPDAPLTPVVVTARKREEPAYEVPVSLSVRDGRAIEHAGGLQLADVAQGVPNVFVDVLNPRQSSIVVRGLGRNPANDGLEGSVGVVVDGVYLGRPGMAVVDYFDVQRVELLRGPQGVLFGKNTTAGLLNVSTRSPTPSFEAYAQATAGNRSYAQLHGAVSGPLGPAVSARVSAFTTRRDGFVHGARADLGEYDRNAVRAQLAWRPTESFDLRLIGDYSEQHEDGPGVVLVDPGIVLEDGSTRPNNFLDRTARAGYVPEFRPFARRNVADAPQRTVASNAGVSAQARWRLDGHTLASNTAWRTWRSRPRSDNDLTPLDVQRQLHFDVDADQLSTELRLASDADARLDYQVGVYAFKQDLTSEFVAAYGRQAADFLEPGLPPRTLDGYEVRTRGEPRTRSAAIFGQVVQSLSERWRVSVGARWTTERKRSLVRRTSFGGEPLAPFESALRAARSRLGAPTSVDATVDEDFASGRISLDYRLGDDGLAYVAVSRGAKSGGINVAIVPSGVDQVLEPEVATSFEAGVRKRWPEGSVDLSLFDMYVDDYQATVRDSLRAATFLANAAEARTRGLELEATWRPHPNASLTFAGGVADARFTSFRTAACPAEAAGRTTCDLSGQRLPGAPPWTVELGGEYSSGGGGVRYAPYVAATWSYAAAYRAEISSYTRIPAYDVLNARLGVRSRSGRWDAWLWARNLLNRSYYTRLAVGGSFNSGVVSGLPADPRTFGVSVRWSQ